MDKNLVIEKIIDAESNMSKKMKLVFHVDALRLGCMDIESIVQKVRRWKYKRDIHGISSPAIEEAIAFLETIDPSIFRKIDPSYFAINQLYCMVYPMFREYTPCNISEVSYRVYEKENFKDSPFTAALLDSKLKEHLEKDDYIMLARYFGFDGVRYNNGKRLYESNRSVDFQLSKLLTEAGYPIKSADIPAKMEAAIRRIRKEDFLPKKDIIMSCNPVKKMIEEIDALEIPEKKRDVIAANKALAEAIEAEKTSIEAENKYLELIKKFSTSKCQYAQDAKDYLARGAAESIQLDNLIETEPRLKDIIKALHNQLGIYIVRDLAREKYSHLMEYFSERDLLLLENALLKMGYTGWETDVSEENILEQERERKQKEEEELREKIEEEVEQRYKKSYDDGCYEEDPLEDFDFDDLDE